MLAQLAHAQRHPELPEFVGVAADLGLHLCRDLVAALLERAYSLLEDGGGGGEGGVGLLRLLAPGELVHGVVDSGGVTLQADAYIVAAAILLEDAVLGKAERQVLPLPALPHVAVADVEVVGLLLFDVAGHLLEAEQLLRDAALLLAAAGEAVREAVQQTAGGLSVEGLHLGQIVLGYGRKRDAALLHQVLAAAPQVGNEGLVHARLVGIQTSCLLLVELADVDEVHHALFEEGLDDGVALSVEDDGGQHPHLLCEEAQFSSLLILSSSQP